MKKDYSCRPPLGKTFLTIGQDFFSIQEYVLSQYNASLESGSTKPLVSFEPAATMFYTDIQELKGLATPVDYGSGIEFATGLAEAFPHSGIQIGLWLNGTEGCRDIIRGRLDHQLQELYYFLKKIKVPRVFLRVGYEFDNPWFGYSDDPKLYKEAFRYMVQFCENHLSVKHCRQKIIFCWHSWAAPKVASLQDFYPGDDFVDWIGVSIFQQLYPWANENTDNVQNTFAGGSMDQVIEVLEFAKEHDKPIMIAESTPFGGMTLEGQPPENLLHNKTYYVDDDTTDIWDLWFEPTLKLIEEYDIEMWSYINCDWDSQPMWTDVGFGDTRLSSSTNVMTQWQEQVLGKETRFLTNLECHSSNAKLVSQSQSIYVGSSIRHLNKHTSSFFLMLLSYVVVVILSVRIVKGIWQCCKRIHEKDTTNNHNTNDREKDWWIDKNDYGSISNE